MAMFSAGTSLAQSHAGTYYHNSYTPKAYKSNEFATSPQNWGIAQDHRGLMYFCNSSGILEFDGISWRMVAGTENLDMFKAVCGSDGRIYTGGDNEFGYLGQSNGTRIQYHSLKHLIPDSLGDFGNILMITAIGDSIVFLSPFHLFTYHNGAVSIYSSSGDRIRRFHDFNGRMIVQLTQAGLCELKDDKPVPLHQDIFPEDRFVRHMFGSASNPILVCNHAGLLQIDNGEIKYKESLLDTLTLWNGDDLNKTVHVIGSSEKGALILDDNAQILEEFHTEYQLTGYDVVSPFFDQNSQLWLATSNGIRYIEYPSQVSYYDETSGIKGIPLCIDETGHELMIGTTEGLFMKSKTNGTFEKVILENEIRSDEFVTDMINLHGDKLILTSHGLYQKRDQQFLRITDEGGLDFDVLDSAQTQLVFGGDGAAGIVIVGKSGGTWQKRLSIEEIEHPILSVSSLGEERIWASMFEISKIDLSESGVRITRLDSTHGFEEEMAPIYSFPRHDTTYFCTSTGLYSWNEANQKLEPDDLLGDEFGKGAMSNPMVMGDTVIWLSHDQGVGAFDLRTKKFLNRDLRRVDYSDVWRIQPTSEGHFWILTTEAVVRYDPAVDDSYQQGFNTVIRGVTTREDSVLFDGYFKTREGAPSLIQPDSTQPVLAYRYNQVSIKYAAAYYHAADKITYSTFLEGQDEHWSQWSSQPFKDYMNLKEGDYTFNVKSRNVYGVEGTAASYSFTVEPPWYRSGWAYLFYAICALLSVWGITALYTIRLRRQKKALEGIVKVRTREIAEEKKKSDDLLLNILPEETAHELKQQGFATTRSHEQVSVLFSDFVSFTSVSETMTPEELVQELNACFSAFDDIIEQAGVEKIKTIGDAYMCASGLNPDDRSSEASLVHVGLAMRDFMRARNASRRQNGLPYFRIRIGIHTGSVVAGVVGKKKFAYDIWGDTVNTASRMESSSEPDELNISGTTYMLIKDDFACEYRGKIGAKNKGEMDMYFVRGPIKKN